VTEAATSGAQAVGSSGRGRWEHIDALKGAGILLVVLGHLIERPQSGSLLLGTIYPAIYSFHMPLFVFVSGIFAREVLKSRDYDKIIWTLFLPLVVFQPIYISVGVATGWNSYSPFAPYWILWFIASLIGWRILLPLVASPAGLAVALLGALLAGFDGGVGYALSASRTIYFLPFFVLGHLYGPQLIEMAQKRRVLFAALFVAAMTAVTFWWWHGLNPAALTGSHDYDSAPPDGSFPGLGRLLVIVLSVAGLLGFSALVPRHSKVLEWLGERSLSIYLLHGLVVMVFVSSGAPDLIPKPLLLPVLLVCAVVIAAATAMLDGPMRRVFSPPKRSGRGPAEALFGLLRRPAERHPPSRM
jgi:fucose 4-O-acetylase-like acetyltransferase